MYNKHPSLNQVQPVMEEFRTIRVIMEIYDSLHQDFVSRLVPLEKAGVVMKGSRPHLCNAFFDLEGVFVFCQ